ncbi:MarR family transcriptional regulator [Parahaliea maris]|uniref:MarR family transcriptional regulator n=1 Tax=Parahaliea maris TaxID=2716870 RepID=A0A5C9A601_9GAMM|nr:MarR family transcriptional regulator [Parahaliea maris]TXS95190.1 MarR family transcriptional regulator [Parahaliea maris]
MPKTSLSEAVHRLMHAYRHLLREGIQTEGIDLPVTHIRTLKGVCHDPGCTAQSIAQRMQRDKAQITRALNDLIGLGLVVREDNPRDRRSQLLRPTASGLVTMAQLDRAEEQAVQQLTQHLNASELASFIEMSNLMANAIERPDCQ